MAGAVQKKAKQRAVAGERGAARPRVAPEADRRTGRGVAAPSRAPSSGAESGAGPRRAATPNGNGAGAAPAEARGAPASGAPARSAADEIERLEELRRALEERVDAAERAHRETVSTISHDLRNALSVIMMSSRMLLRTIEPEAHGRRHVEAIARAADDINQLAQDLVDASSIERGSLRVDREAQELGPIVDLAFEAIRHTAATKPIEIAREVPGGLRVAASRERLSQALASLLSNAARFTPKGGRITVRAERWGGGARLSIADTGPGLAADQRELAFSRHPGARRPAGQLIGLGPFVARGVVEAHGGSIWVDSAPGQGTTVHLTIPGGEPAGEVAAAP